MAHGCDENGIGIKWINNDASNTPGFFESQLLPSVASIDRLVDTVAVSTLERMNVSPVPAQITLVLTGSTASEPIAATGWSSKIGSQLVPPSLEPKDAT